MNLTAFLPSLAWPDPAFDACSGLDLGAGTRLLGRAAHLPCPDALLEAALAREFGLPADAVPVAALTALADGLDAARGHWMRADPVHLKLGRERATLVDAGAFGLGCDEADALVATLNDHFADAGPRFVAPHPLRWYVQETAPRELLAVDLPAAAGRDASSCQPGGAGALAWTRILTEVQMLLHDHPVNEAREARGAPAVNSLWAWGAGALPAVRPRPGLRIAPTHALALGLGRAAQGTPADAAGDDVAGLLRAAQGGDLIVVDDTLRAPARYGDLDAWRAARARIEVTWFAPLAGGAWPAGLERLEVVVTDVPSPVRISARAGDRWKLWRRPRAPAGRAP